MFIESSYIVMQEYGQIQEYTVVLEIIWESSQTSGITKQIINRLLSLLSMCCCNKGVQTT